MKNTSVAKVFFQCLMSQWFPFLMSFRYEFLPWSQCGGDKDLLLKLSPPSPSPSASSVLGVACPQLAF